MTDVEREESKKTVVAFITGLLIGGLLVWVFSSTPATDRPADETDEDTTEVVDTDSATGTDDSDDTDEDPGDTVSVDDQTAGSRVLLGDIDFPTERGWVVVRELNDGVAGKILGAARYSTKDGLLPKEVELITPTKAGATYELAFYTDEGAGGFSSREDKVMEGLGATFKVN